MSGFKNWKNDFQSSLVVFLVALPLCLGIALASNAPLSSGLIAGIIGGIVVGFFSGSSISVSGPAAGLTVIVATAIGELGSFQAFTLAVVLSGVIQIFFGLIKAGRIGNYFPSSVIKGMLAAIGLILIMKQLPYAIGYGADNFFHPGVVIISLLSLGLMLTWEKLGKKSRFFLLIPGALVAVVLSVGFGFLFAGTNFALLPEQFVKLPFNGGVAEFVSGFVMPDWSRIFDSKIITVAITLALVGSLESLLSVEASDKIDPQGNVTNKNRELFAQGIGNTLSGLVGGLPVTAVIVRTSANVEAGARSKLSSMFHGVWLFLCVVSIPHVLNHIPLGALAAVLLLVGYKLTKPALIMDMYKKGMNQFLPFGITILAILATDLLTGIIFGIFVGFVFLLRSYTRKSIVMVSEENRYLVSFQKDISFLHKEDLSRKLISIPAKSSVIIDGSGLVSVDDDIAEMICEFIHRSRANEVIVELKKSRLALCPLFRED